MKKYKDWSSFDIISFLENYEIDYSDSGKNIGQGFIGLESCPFCEAPGYHFGIKMESNVGSCWVCGETASAPKLVQQITELKWHEVYRFMNDYIDDDRWIPESPLPGKEVLFPEDMGELPIAACNYLTSRNFFPMEIEKKYKIKSTPGWSFLEIEDRKWCFNHRIIIPIVMEKHLVSYTARSYVGHDPKYMNAPIEAGIIPVASCIYNIDTVKDKVIIVEGPTDVWRMGTESIAMMGVKFTSEQIAYLGTKNIKEAFVLYDEGAEERARELSMALSSVIHTVKRITLNTKSDPGDLGVADALKIKYELLGRV